MKNEEIIEKIAREVYGDEAVDTMGEDLPLHTVKGWKARSYNVKKGEHGIECKLWRKKGKSEGLNDQFYLSKCFLFTKDQVELIEKGS